MKPELWIVVAGLSGAAAVGFGAYGAHGLAADPATRETVRLAVSYQLWHSLAIAATALLARLRPAAYGAAQAAAFLFAVGIVCFPGSLYAGALGGGSMALAPVGGVALIAGWLALAAAGWHGRRS